MIYRFTLRDKFGVLQFGTEKVSNWDEVETSIVASTGYNGLMSEFTSSFSFVDSVRTRMLQNKEEYGTNAKVYLTVEVGNENRDVASFERIGKNIEFIADFTSSRITELAYDIDFFYSDFYLQIKKAETEKINITNEVDLKGNAITPYTDYLTSAIVEDRQLQLNSQLKRDIMAVGGNHNQTGTNSFSSAFPFDQVYNSDQADITPTSLNFYIGAATDPTYPNVGTNYFFVKSEEVKLYNFSYSGSFKLNWKFTTGLETPKFRIDLVFNHINYTDGGVYSPITTQVLATKEYQATVQLGVNEAEVVFENITFDNQINIGVDDFVGYQITITKIVGGTGVNYDFSEVTLTPINESANILNASGLSDYDATNSKVIYPHELFERYIELITGRKGAFYSEFFGRTELGYAQDGEGAYMMVCDGHMLRKLEIIDNPFNISFKKLFEGFHFMFCLTAFVDQVGDVEVFRVERFTDVYNNNEVADLGQLIADYELNINDKLTFNEIKIGYKDRVPETLNGLEIYNGELNYSVPVDNSDAPISLVSEFITSDYIIEETRRKTQEQYPTEDTKYDKDIFVLSCFRDGAVLRIKQPRLTGDTVTGCLSPDKATNYDITPARNLRNWGSFLQACIINTKISNFILTKSASNNKLNTLLIGETESINEGVNIDVDLLDSPVFQNENLLIGDCILTVDQYKAITANNYGTIKVTDVKGNSYWGYINKCIFNPNAEKGNFELILSNRKNG